MPLDAAVAQLVEEALDSGRTPDEVCADAPHLLAAVRARWQRCRWVEGMLDHLLPPPVPDDRWPSNAPPARPAAPLAGETPPRERLPEVPGYELEAVLGRGGMGIVYRATDLGLQRRVALKMILSGEYASRTERARFLREARAVAALRHPHVMQVYDADEHDGRPYFTMELVEGGTLAARLAGTPLAPADAAALLGPLAGAVHAAHEAGIVHRDLKPANVLLDRAGTPKVADFGLARRTDAGDETVTLSGPGPGTPSYMAPEQVAGNRGAVGPAADVYGLGAVLYEMLTGRPPFRGHSPAETARQVLHDEPAPPSRLNGRVPRDLETICLKCLSKDPRRRYASAAAIGDDLLRFTRGEPIAARRAGRVERAAKWVRRRPAEAGLWAAAAMIVLATAGGAMWWASDRATVAGGVNAELREVARLQREAKWAEAEATLARADGLLGQRTMEGVRARLERARRDAKLVRRLEEMHSMFFTPGAGKDPRADGDTYAAIFRDLGLGDDETDPEVVATRVVASDIREALVGALFDWRRSLGTWPSSKEVWVRTVALAVERELKPDTVAWRERAMDETAWRDPVTAAALESDPAFAKQRRELLLVVYGWVFVSGRSTVPYLLRMQRAHPGDVSANLAVSAALRWEALSTGKPSYDAVRFAQAAVALRPDYSAARVRLAEALGDMGRAQEAVDECREAIRLNREDRNARRVLALRLADARQLTEAIPELEISLEEWSEDTESRAKLATCLEDLGRVDEAIPHYRQAIRDFQAKLPQHRFHEEYAAQSGARTRLRAALVRQGRWDEMLDEWREQLEAAPFGDWVWAGYAECCLFRGREDEYRRARGWLLDKAEGSEDPRRCEIVGRACLLLPTPEVELLRATALIDRALAADTARPMGYRAYYQAAKALADYRAGRHEAALAKAEGEAAGVLGPVPLLVAAMARWQLGQPAEARAALAQALGRFDWAPEQATFADAWMYHALRREAERLILTAR